MSIEPTSEDPSNPMMLCRSAFVERLPYALSYAANLEPGNHAVLFYDSLVVAAEYFCAFIEEGMKREEPTYFTGLEPTRYRKLFEQVGIRVEQLENCGYLRNLSTQDFQTLQFDQDRPPRNIDNPFQTSIDEDPHGVRFVHIHNTHQLRNSTLQELIEEERRTHKRNTYSTTSLCCYDSRTTLENTPYDFLKQLLKEHDHCLFQGVAMPTSRLLSLLTNAVYPKLTVT